MYRMQLMLVFVIFFFFSSCGIPSHAMSCAQREFRVDFLRSFLTSKFVIFLFEMDLILI